MREVTIPLILFIIMCIILAGNIISNILERINRMLEKKIKAETMKLKAILRKDDNG